MRSLSDFTNLFETNVLANSSINLYKWASAFEKLAFVYKYFMMTVYTIDV